MFDTLLIKASEGFVSHFSNPVSEFPLTYHSELIDKDPVSEAPGCFTQPSTCELVIVRNSHVGPWRLAPSSSAKRSTDGPYGVVASLPPAIEDASCIDHSYQ
jgi:hypothetical protein